MSTAAQAPPPVPPGQRELRIYSHSALFYWWPVWAVGFLMAALTAFDQSRIAFVPHGTLLAQIQGDVTLGSGQVPAGFLDEDRNAINTPLDLKGRKVLIAPPAPPGAEDKLELTPLHISRRKELGVLFSIVLLIIIVISNVPLRGLWSVIIILLIILFAVVAAFAGVWDKIFEYFSYLRIHINAGGYVFISLVLFIIWAVTVFIFDHRTYVAVTSGQVRVCMAVGAGETVYDTTGMTFTKRQDDLFRHWIVGLGSGDLIIHRTATTQEIDLPNVLFVGSKIKEIEKLVKEREVV